MTTQWIAKRTIRDASGRVFEVAVAAPEPVDPSQDVAAWSCKFRIERDGQETIRDVKAEDSMQALSLAIESLGQSLEASGEDLTWMLPSGDVEKGFTGFPRQVPYAMGFDFYRRVVKLVDDEVQKYVDEQRRRAIANGLLKSTP